MKGGREKGMKVGTSKGCEEEGLKGCMEAMDVDKDEVGGIMDE